MRGGRGGRADYGEEMAEWEWAQAGREEKSMGSWSFIAQRAHFIAMAVPTPPVHRCSD
jgi:hypothetical protein